MHSHNYAFFYPLDSSGFLLFLYLPVLICLCKVMLGLNENRKSFDVCLTWKALKIQGIYGNICIMEIKITKKPGGRQPKTHAPKTRMQSHLRRQKLIRGLIEGKAISQIAPTLDLSPKSAVSQAKQMLLEPATQMSFARILVESGLSDNFLAKRLFDLSNATTMVYAQKDGLFTDQREIPAHETRRKTIELVCRLAGHLKEQDTSTINNNGLMQIVVAQLHTG